MSVPLANPFGVGALVRGFARWLFRLTGWKTEGAVLQPPRFVLIAAPHTSNWDAVILIVAAYCFGVRLSWYVKDSVFFWPLGPIVRYFGGVPIDRRARRNTVQQAVETFAQREHFILAVPPEGTRGRADGWKTGFYHIARGAGVPIVLGFIDYARKVAGLGPTLVPTGDIERDFQVLAEFYNRVTPRFPQHRGEVRPAPARETPAPPAS